MSASTLDRVRRADALILTSLLWFMVLFLRYVLPPLFGRFQVQYEVSRAELGLAYSALMVAYSAVQFPAGWLADRLGMVKVIVGGAMVFGAASLMISFSLSWYGMVAGLVLVGVGTGGHKTVSLPLLSDRYPRSPGRTLGLMDMVGQFGGVAGPGAVLVIAMLDFDWRIIFLFGGCVIFLLAGTLFGQHRWGLWEAGAGEPTAQHDLAEDANTDSQSRQETPSLDGEGQTERSQATDPEDDGGDSYFALFLDARFSIFIVSTILVAFAWNGAIAFLPLYLTDSAGVSSTLANGLFAVLFAASLAQPVVGEISDRIGELSVMSVAIAVSGFSIAGLLVVSSPLIVGVCVIGFGVGMHGYRPVRDAYLSKLIPDAIAGGTFGVVRTVMIISGSISPFIIGLLIDFGSFVIAFTVLTAAVFTALVLFTRLHFAVERA